MEVGVQKAAEHLQHIRDYLEVRCIDTSIKPRQTPHSPSYNNRVLVLYNNIKLRLVQYQEIEVIVRVLLVSDNVFCKLTHNQ